VNAAFLSFTPDSRWLVSGALNGPTQRLVAIPTDGTERTRTLATLTSPSFGVDVAADGSLYFDQYTRPMQLRRFAPATGRTEAVPIPPMDKGLCSPLLPLPDGRTLISVLAGAGTRVMVVAPGRDATPFMLTAEETNGPLALIGRDRVAMLIGSGEHRGVAITSIATGQLVQRLPGLAPVSMAGSPDGKTLYYSKAGAIWAIPIGGGEARRIRDGDAVAVDPGGRYLIIQVGDVRQVRLFRVPLDGTPESEITVRGESRIASGVYLSSNAVGADGRIIVQVVLPASWFWPIALLDPASGAMTLVPPGATADMRGGWSTDGRIVYYTQDLQSALWRFRPVTTNRGAP
jgi:hypothetical protein